MAAAAQKSGTQFQMLAIDRLHESTFNPRRTFRDDGGELVSSVQSKGILQPLLVRPRTAAGIVVPNEFEVICGHRRHRAATEAGLAEVPCVIRELTDEAALECALIENAARQDVAALEEADALQRLVKQYGYTVQGLAKRLGKSESTIRSRLKLANIGAEGRKAIEDGKLEPQIGLIAARIPNAKLQGEFVRRVLAGERWGENAGKPLGVRPALKLAHEEFMLEVRETGGPFDPADASLVPEAGACHGCIKRSDAQPDLFSEVTKGPPLCLDLPCFKKKEDAAWERRKEAAAREGKRVASAAETEKLLSYNAPVQDLDSRCYEDAKNRTYRELLKKLPKGEEVPITLARANDGSVHELVPKDELKGLLKKAGHDFAQKHGSSNPYADQQRQREKAAKVRDEVGRRALAAIVERHSGGAVARDHDELWRFMFARVMELSSMEAIVVAGKRRVIVEKADRDAAEKGLTKLADELTGRELEALVIELSIAGAAKHSTWSDGYNKHLKSVSELYGVDIKKLDSQVKAEAKNPKKLPVCKGYTRANGVKVRTCNTRVPTDGPQVCTRCAKAQKAEDAKGKKGRAA